MKEEANFCRLCAKMRPNEKFLNIDDNAQNSTSIIEKLQLFNVKFDPTDSVLPKTVCNNCVDTLNEAVNFIGNIEKAQTKLVEIFAKIDVKSEPWADDHLDSEDFSAPTPDFVVDVKIEPNDDKIFEKVKNEKIKVESQDKSPKKSKIGLKKPQKKVVDEFDVPLSKLKSAWKDYSWLCAVCDVRFPTMRELIGHSIDLHNNCTTFKCWECNKRKLKHDSFIVHLKRHNNNLRLSCHYCFEVFSNIFELKRHISTHMPYPNVCQGCHSTFETVDELISHKNKYYTDKRATRVLRKHTDEELTCQICNKMFKTTSNLTLHQTNMHSERQRDHTCERCGKSYFNKQTLLSHMMLHDNIRPHQCKICKHSFRTMSRLRAHIGTHEATKPFSCEQCGKCFRIKKSLQSHQIVHTDQMPYVCIHCQRAFRFKALLVQHLRQHTGIKPYSCDICERSFTNWANYNKHMKRRHGVSMAKKKHTPDGVFPINPLTGEVQIVPPSSSTEEWKRSVLNPKRKKKTDFVEESLGEKVVT